MRSFWLTRTFWALSLGLFLNAYSFGVAAVALTWVPHRPWTPTVLLLWAPICLVLGIAVGGLVADLRGRQHVLRWGPVGYGIGSACLSMGAGLGAALVGSGLLLVTAGIESNTILAYSQELLPEHKKRQAMYAELNFVNLGGLALAALAYWGHGWQPSLLRHGTTILPMVFAAASLWMRRSLPESALWQSSQRQDETMPTDYGLRMAVAIGFSFANTSGFSLLTYAFGAEFLPRHFHHLILVSTLTAFGVGLTARWIGRISPKKVLLGGYGVACLASCALVVVERPGHPGFWPVLFILSAFTSLSYLAEDTFKSDVWPSVVRGRAIGTVRSIGLLGYAVLLLTLRHTAVRQFLAVIAGVWGVGLAAAVLWWIGQRRLSQDQETVAGMRIRVTRRRRKLR